MIIAIAWVVSILIAAFGVWLITSTTAYHRGHREGYDSGHREGYDSGVTAGKHEGYTIGEKFGYAHGSAEGRVLGEKAGHDRAVAEAAENERALQALHRETVSTLSAKSVQKAPRKFHKRAAQGKKPNGNVKGRSRAP